MDFIIHVLSEKINYVNWINFYVDYICYKTTSSAFICPFTPKIQKIHLSNIKIPYILKSKSVAKSQGCSGKCA